MKPEKWEPNRYDRKLTAFFPMRALKSVTPSKHEVAGSSPAGIATQSLKYNAYLPIRAEFHADDPSDKTPVSFDLICGDLRAKQSRIRNRFVTNWALGWPGPTRARNPNRPPVFPNSQLDDRICPNPGCLKPVQGFRVRCPFCGELVVG